MSRFWCIFFSLSVRAMVQVLHSYKAERFKSIEKDLIALIGSRLKGLQFIKCSKQSSIDPSLKLIVLSILTSRLGTDASNAITDIENLKNTALVLIHLKESHSLPMQRSSDILTDEKFQGLGGIFDFANGDGKGFYQCSMNEESLLNICHFLQMEPGH